MISMTIDQIAIGKYVGLVTKLGRIDGRVLLRSAKLVLVQRFSDLTPIGLSLIDLRMLQEVETQGESFEFINGIIDVEFPAPTISGFGIASWEEVVSHVASTQQIVLLYSDDADEPVLAVGAVLDAAHSTATIRYISPDAVWGLDIISVKLSDVYQMDLTSDYLRILTKYAHQ